MAGLIVGAAAVGSSHRMLIYHFGSREGLVAAVVQWREADQRALLGSLAEQSSSPTDLVRRPRALLSDPGDPSGPGEALERYLQIWESAHPR